MRALMLVLLTGCQSAGEELNSEPMGTGGQEGCSCPYAVCIDVP